MTNFTKPESAAKHNDQTVRRQELGEELRRLRAAARMSLRDAAYITCLHYPNIAKMERGEVLRSVVKL